VDELPEMELSVEPAHFFAGELHSARSYGIERIIAADAHVIAGMPLGTALADNDIADLGNLSAKELNAKALGLRIAT
jgi:hypothetical protein